MARQVKRWSLWATEWLEVILSCVPVIDKMPLPQGARAWLERRLSDLVKFALNIIMIRAALAQHPPENIRNRFSVACAAARHDVRVQRRLSLRASIGGKLRRAVKMHGSLQQRAETILRALRRQDQLLARVVRRMRRGLSRRLSLHTRATETLACFAVFADVALVGAEMAALGAGSRADTS